MEKTQTRRFDAVVVGAGPIGCYFAHELATRGNSVLVLEACSADRLGGSYSVFHLAAREFTQFELPRPQKGDDLMFEYSRNEHRSAFDHYARRGSEHILGVHRRRYLMRMHLWAMEAGADILYETPCEGLMLDENGLVCGVRYNWRGEMRVARTNLVADCSGIASAVRCDLPSNFGIENRPIGAEELLYVNLRHVRWNSGGHTTGHARSWPYYKTWEAPNGEESGAVLGVRANFSASCADAVFEHFQAHVKLPPYELERTEGGAVPCRRPPYSMAGDGVLVMGDAACLTKPSCGEGVASALVQAKIAVEVVDPLLKRGDSLTCAALWPVNTRYYARQGRAFAAQLATVTGALGTSAEENEFLFQHNIFFSEDSFQALAAGRELTFSFGRRLRLMLTLLGGVLRGRMRPATLGRLRRAMKNSARISKLYAEYPGTPEGYRDWKTRADAAWARVPTMAEAARAAEKAK